jgi:hypothetical protein
MLVNVCVDVEKENLRSDESAEGSACWLSRVRKLEILANSCLLRVLESDGGERLDVEVGSFGARLDELSSQGEDGTGLEGSVESSRDGLSPGGNTDEGLVTSLNGDNGTGSGKDIRRVDERSGSEVGGDTDSLEDTGSLDHGVGAGESSIEVVGACIYGLRASGGDGGDES